MPPPSIHRSTLRSSRLPHNAERRVGIDVDGQLKLETRDLGMGDLAEHIVNGKLIEDAPKGNLWSVGIHNRTAVGAPQAGFRTKAKAKARIVLRLTSDPCGQTGPVLRLLS